MPAHSFNSWRSERNPGVLSRVPRLFPLSPTNSGSSGSASDRQRRTYFFSARRAVHIDALALVALPHHYQFHQRVVRVPCAQGAQLAGSHARV